VATIQLECAQNRTMGNRYKKKCRKYKGSRGLTLFSGLFGTYAQSLRNIQIEGEELTTPSNVEDQVIVASSVHPLNCPLSGFFILKGYKSKSTTGTSFAITADVNASNPSDVGEKIPKILLLSVLADICHPDRWQIIPVAAHALPRPSTSTRTTTHTWRNVLPTSVRGGWTVRRRGIVLERGCFWDCDGWRGHL